MRSHSSLVLAALALGACQSPSAKSQASAADFLTPDKLAGRWRQTYEVALPLTDGKPETTSGTSECQIVCGGRYVLEHATVDPRGEPMESYELLGWDARDECTSLWFDASNTWWCQSRGEMRDDGSMVFDGTMHDPAGDRAFRMVLKAPGDGSLVREVYDTLEDGKLRLVMKVTSTR